MSLIAKLKRLLSHPASPPARAYPLRKDVVRYAVQEGVYLEVFWKVLEIGRGPAVSLFVHGDEVLKFDCFGQGKGHFHVSERPWRGPEPPTAYRVYLPEKTVEAQIERAVFELRSNAVYYLQRNHDPRIRRCQIDPQRLEAAIERARVQMLEYLRTVSALRRETPPGEGQPT